MTAIISILTVVLMADITFDLGIPGGGFIFLIWFFLAGTYTWTWHTEFKERGQKCISFENILVWVLTAAAWSLMFDNGFLLGLVGFVLMIFLIVVNWGLALNDKTLTTEQSVQKVLVNGLIIVMAISIWLVLFAPLFNGKKKS